MPNPHNARTVQLRIFDSVGENIRYENWLMLVLFMYVKILDNIAQVY